MKTIYHINERWHEREDIARKEQRMSGGELLSVAFFKGDYEEKIGEYNIDSIDNRILDEDWVEVWSV